MDRKIKTAAIQMLGEVAATENRLERAKSLIEEAAKSGADLIVLPELFNTGYSYSSATHYRAETLEGQTVTWMRETADAHQVHLAGSLLLLNGNEVFNSMLLFAPDGRMWRYNKNYPWGWERGYFRDGSGTTVADTDLGRIGMLICWDLGHPKLWQQYAGQVDLMLISSCPPNVGRMKYRLPDGRLFDPAQVASMAAELGDQVEKVFGPVLDKQVQWLNVPTIHASTVGPLQSAVPYATASLLAASTVMPRVVTMLPQANQLQITCDFAGQTKILDGGGRVINSLTADSGEGFTVAEIELPGKRPQPAGPQPSIDIIPITYIFSDYILPWLTIPVYRQGVRRAWGSHMAPLDLATRQRTIGLLVGTAFILLIAYIFGRKRSPNGRLSAGG